MFYTYMKKEDILKFLDSWNFWNNNPNPGIKREFYTNRIENFLGDSEVPILIETGIRRAGKSFIAKQVAKDLVERNIAKSRILVINLEDERLIDRNYTTLLEIYQTYKEVINPSETSIVILDEAQEIDGWEHFVRGISERGEAKFIVTGSSSKLLDSEFSSLLSGRHVVVYVHPLDALEFKLFSRNRNPMDRFIIEGGFPAVALSRLKTDLVSNYFDTIILKDVIQRFRIKKQGSLIKLAKFYVTSVGSKITFRSISKFLDLPVKTVFNFSIYLEAAYLIFFVDRFSFSAKKSDKSPRKVYSIDNSFPSFLGINPIEIKGRLLENAIAGTLYLISRHVQDFKFYYWNENKKEVDFVIKDGHNYEALQVTYAVNSEKTKTREVEGLLDCASRLNLASVMIVTMDFSHQETINDITINYIAAAEWIERKLTQYGFA